MKYKLSPLNLGSGLSIGFAIFYGLNPGPMHFGMVLSIFLTLVALVGLFIDYVIQKAAKNYLKSFLVEVSLLLALFIGYSWTQRTKTLLIPDRPPSKYLVTIYNVDSAPELPSGLFTWSYKIKVPENGILLTSTKMSRDLPQTEIETYSGKRLNTEEIKLSWGRFSTEEFECDGKTYQYQSWLVDSSCCMYSSNEQKEFKDQLQKQFCKLKKAL
jgi:hypothetical protein